MLDRIRRLVVPALALLWMLVPAGPAASQDWVGFVDETATRLVAAPEVGVDDVEEKDIASGDVDNDGDVDVVVVRKTPFTNPGGKRNVLFMNEDGVMVDRTASRAPHFLDLTNDRDVELADVNGDGWLDIITGGTFHEQPRILINRGALGGVWQGFQHQPARLPLLVTGGGNGPFFCGLAVGDVTGDGFPDIYFTDYGGLVLGNETLDLDDRLLVNNGNGFFSDQTATRVGIFSESLFGTDADIADMNGDGFNDIVKTNSTGFFSDGEAPEGGNPSPAGLVLYNDGTGTFTFMDEVYSVAPYMVAPADFTQDDRLDLVVVDDFQDAYLVNTGNDAQGHAQFTSHGFSNSPKTSGLGGNVKLADLDNDGVLDIMVADVDTDIPGCSRRLALLQGQGTPPDITYTDPLGSQIRPWNAVGTHDMEALHIDDDDALDLFVGTCTGIKVFMGVSRTVFADGFESGDTSAWTTTVP